MAEGYFRKLLMDFRCKALTVAVEWSEVQSADAYHVPLCREYIGMTQQVVSPSTKCYRLTHYRKKSSDTEVPKLGAVRFGCVPSPIKALAMACAPDAREWWMNV